MQERNRRFDLLAFAVPTSQELLFQTPADSDTFLPDSSGLSRLLGLARPSNTCIPLPSR